MWESSLVRLVWVPRSVIRLVWCCGLWSRCVLDCVLRDGWLWVFQYQQFLDSIQWWYSSIQDVALTTSDKDDFAIKCWQLFDGIVTIQELVHVWHDEGSSRFVLSRREWFCHMFTSIVTFGWCENEGICGEVILWCQKSGFYIREDSLKHSNCTYLQIIRAIFPTNSARVTWLGQGWSYLPHAICISELWPCSHGSSISLGRRTDSAVPVQETSS